MNDLLSINHESKMENHKRWKKLSDLVIAFHYIDNFKKLLIL